MASTIIAEAGVNHNGSLDRALELVDIAAECRADIVKFQTFRTDALVTKAAPRANYQAKNLQADGDQGSMLRSLELNYDAYRTLHQRSAECGIEFLSTPFDSESLKFLVSEGLIKRIKVPSGEITNLPLLLEMAQTRLPLILSSGMGSLGDLEMALGTIAFGLLGIEAKPGLGEFWKAFCSPEGQKVLSEKVVVLQCTTEYPAVPSTINLRAMDTLSHAFGLPVGLSDHSEGIHIPIAAVARGAQVIEKHFTVSRGLPGPDHKSSIEPAELRRMVNEIRDVEAALGTGRKLPAPIEIANRKVARKVLVARRPIAAGEVFHENNITTKRSVGGVSPAGYWSLLGKKALRDYVEDESIDGPES